MTHDYFDIPDIFKQKKKTEPMKRQEDKNDYDAISDQLKLS